MPKASDLVNSVFDIAIDGVTDLDAKAHEWAKAADGGAHQFIAYLESLRAKALGLFQGDGSEPAFSGAAAESIEASAEKLREVISANDN